ncbi:cytidine deaminase [bacterium]|nr:cytidine deaminase [bacterium]
MDYNELLNIAKEVSQKAYAPYSKFRVGACVLSDDGRIYKGCNFENSSYGLSICAERNAIGSAIADGVKKIKAVAIYSPNQENCLPCGACRQVMAEFRPDDDVDIITVTNGQMNVYKLSYLLPESFVLPCI